MRTSRVEEVMTERVIVGRPETPFKEIVTAMLDNDISALPIAGQDGRVLGVVSDADLVLKEAEPDPPEEGALLVSARIDEPMTSGWSVLA